MYPQLSDWIKTEGGDSVQTYFCDVINHLKSIIHTMAEAQVMEGSTGNSKNVPKKSTRLGRMMGFWQYTLRLRCEPKSLQPACTKFSNFVPILDTSTFTTPSLITSGYPIVQSLCFISNIYKQCFCLHLLCFISNVYKQRFLGLVEFLKKISNGLVYLNN